MQSTKVQVTSRDYCLSSHYMTPVKPDIDPNGKYNVSLAAALLGVHRVTIWRYVKEGKLKPYIQSSNSRMRFLGKDLLRLWENEQ